MKLNLASYIFSASVIFFTAMQIWWDYLLKYFLKDGRTNEHKKLRKWLLTITLFLLVANQAVVIINNYIKDHQTEADRQDFNHKIGELTNQLAKITGENSQLLDQVAKITGENSQLLDQVSQGFRDICSEFSTNTTIVPSIRLAVLQDAAGKTLKEREQIEKSHELINTDAVDMKTLRQEREYELSLQENQKRQEAIQRGIDDIQKAKDAEEAERITEQNLKNQKWADQKLIQTEKLFAKQILPAFDYTIRELDKTLAKFASETGQARHSDFLGQIPTIYASNLTEDGLIVNGTNSIGIGTNLLWNFCIFTSITHLYASPVFSSTPYLGPENYASPPFTRHPSLDFAPNNIIIGFSQHYTSINIVVNSTNGASILIIEPYIPWNSDIGYSFTPNDNNSFYNQILIKLTVPNGLDMNELLPSTNYKTEINKALHRLVAAQDQQSPLKQIQ